ncbi:Myosin heavy chain-related protein [Thalictrum thalictroides]|uniref:Myosin heavy chain-related protein n=1 Tax=Thalictrum thalictroides TaxID=46969 RepID=A0A7J6VT23_THATH|nr:Myosin heavy chain-related protein [Thalictrum thalictroides]
MFRLHRHKSDKSKEKIDFKFSQFQILQVPKGWDKLFVSIISVETGKTVAKSSKALVRNGKCLWTESLSESIWASPEDASKGIEDNLFKLVVSMGSARSGILGEASINLTTYISSKSPVPVSLPLKKSNQGTILQLKIHCLNPRATVRDEQWQEATSGLEENNADYDETDSKSDVSDISYAKSIGSSSSNHLGSGSQPREVGSRNTSFSASGSRHSSDSAEGFVDKSTFSPRHNFSGDLYSPTGIQDSSASQNSATHGAGPAEDLPRSNHSSFSSKFTAPVSNGQSQRQEMGNYSSNSLAMSSLRNVNSSKDLLETAEDTIEDLRAEAKMWERNARKVMLDLELLRKECTDQSRQRADLEMEFSAACTERDGFKKEIEQLKMLFEESKLKQTASEHSISQAEGITHIQKELESEIKFQKESNTNLAVQLEKTQESNIELVSILQELEETIEKQRLEIENLSTEKASGHGIEDANLSESDEKQKVEVNVQKLQESQTELQAMVHLLEKTLEDKDRELELERKRRNQMLLEVEAEWKSKLSTKGEEIIELESKLSDLLNTQGSNENRLSDGVDSDLTKEIEVLKEKFQELENECNELTEENLELIFKLKESKKDLRIGGDSFSSASSELQSTVSSPAYEPEVDVLRSQIHQLKEEMKNKDMLCDGVSSTQLEVQLVDLQNKITDMELQLHYSQDKACELEAQLHSSQLEMEEHVVEITALKQQLQSYQENQTSKGFQHNFLETKIERFESRNSMEMSELFSELYNQLQVTLTHVKRPWYKGSSHVSTEREIDHNDLVGSDSPNITTQKFQAEAILNNFNELNKLLEMKTFECGQVFQRIEAELRERNAGVTDALENLEQYDLKENAPHNPSQELENLKTKLEDKDADLSNDLLAKGTETEALEASLLLKEEEIEVLRHSQKEAEAQISDLRKEKLFLEEKLEVISRGSNITSKCLDDVRNDMVLLTSNLDSHVSANKMLERKSSELESGKRELEFHLLELEEENVQLSERLSGMEAQLRYLTDEKESGRLELENSKSLSADLRNEIIRLETEIEIQKGDLKKKFQDMQKRWFDAQEECEYLKRANPKLQATAESLIEECDSMQKLNGELRKQKLELHERCTHLEAELKESRNNFSDCCKKIEILELKFSSMLEDFTSKEKVLTSELDSLLQENKEHKEKLILEESLLSQMYMEKTGEVESLQREVAHLIEQISATHDEREQIASNAVLEVSTLRADKTKLENALQEAHAKVKSSEAKLQILQLESELKVQELISELTSYKQHQDVVMADHKKLQRLLDEVKSSEEKFRSTVSELELKLTASEYERQQVVEEISNLKIQLLKIGQLQDEIVTLKNSLNEVKFEKGKLESSLQLLSGDCEELKAEKILFVEKFSSMQKAVSELDDCKRSKIALEEKLLRLEGDLTAKEALCAQDAELKNELNRIKRANSQFQRKIQCLEGEKDEWLNRAQTLEEELNLKKEEKQHQSRSVRINSLEFESDNQVEQKSLEGQNEMKRNGGPENGRPSMKIGDDIKYQKEGDSKNLDHNGIAAKIQLLENELAEALEANNMYKAQLKKLLTDGQNGYANGSKKSTSVEAELKDIRERYFHMSLKFAEVEAQREELVMQIKTLKSGRRWFS